MTVKEVVEAVDLIKSSLKGYQVIQDGYAEVIMFWRVEEKSLIECFGDYEVVRFSICDKVRVREEDLFLVLVLKRESEESSGRTDYASPDYMALASKWEQRFDTLLNVLGEKNERAKR